MNVSNAFLHGESTEDVLCCNQEGFEDSDYPTHVCKLHRALYGLKQSPKAWFHHLTTFLLDLEFVNSTSNHSMFIYKFGSNILVLLIYVNDIAIFGSSRLLIDQFIAFMKSEFSMKDLGPLSYFLGVVLLPNSDELLLLQRKYVLDLLVRFDLT